MIELKNKIINKIMNHKKNYDAIIVGSGTIGLSIAFELTKENLNIALVSPREQSGMASLAAGAMVDAFGEIESLDSDIERQRLRMEVKAQRRYPDWLKEITQRSGQEIFHRQGIFILSNNGGEHDIPKMNLMREQMRAFGEDFEEVDPKDIPGLKPNYLFRAQDAMLMKSGLSVDTTQLLPALEEALQKSDRCTRIDDSVTSVDPEGNTWKVHTANNGTLFTEKAIVCAGAHTFKIIGEQLRVKAALPKLYFGRGTSITVINGPDLPYCIRTPNRALSCGIHMVPRHGNRIYLGATNLFGTDYDHLPTGPTCGEVHTLFEAIMGELNTSLRNVCMDYTSWGLRPISQFNYPMAGATNIPGLFIATGTHRTGVHLSPVIAEFTAAEVLGKELSEENIFSPQKPYPKDTDVDVALGIRSLLATALFPNGRLPYNRMTELETFMTEMFKLAMNGDQKGGDRERLQQVLKDVPLSEQGILRVYHEILEQHLPQDGPYPT